VLLPDTLFIKDGKFDFISSLDRDCSLVIDKKTEKSNLQVRMRLEEAVRERRYDTVEYGMTKLISCKTKEPRDSVRAKRKLVSKVAQPTRVGIGKAMNNPKLNTAVIV
jgi:hypothetical protein